MGNHVEIRKGDSIANLVEELAPSVKDDAITLPADRAVAEGEWVQFTLRLADGTEVMEGVGKSGGSIPRGDPISHHDLVLTQLQLDGRNEIMWERLLIAAQAAQGGDDTGTIPLGDGDDLEDVGPASAAASKPAAQSVPPPLPDRSSSAPKASASAPPPPKVSPSAPPPKASASAPPPKPAAGATSTSGATPKEPRTAKPAGGGPHTLDVPSELVTRARRLSSQLPRDVVGRPTGGKPPEDAVLATALRMGLAALEAQRSPKT